MTEKISTKTNMSGDIDELDEVDPNYLPCPIGEAIGQRVVDIANGDYKLSKITEEEYMISGLIDMSGGGIPDPPKIKEGIMYCLLDMDDTHTCIGKATIGFNPSMDDATVEARIDAYNVAAIHSVITHDGLACTCGEHDIQLANAPTNDLHYTGFSKA